MIMIKDSVTVIVHYFEDRVRSGSILNVQKRKNKSRLSEAKKKIQWSIKTGYADLS